MCFKITIHVFFLKYQLKLKILALYKVLSFYFGMYHFLFLVLFLTNLTKEICVRLGVFVHNVLDFHITQTIDIIQNLMTYFLICFVDPFSINFVSMVFILLLQIVWLHQKKVQYFQQHHNESVQTASSTGYFQDLILFLLPINSHKHVLSLYYGKKFYRKDKWLWCDLPPSNSISI